MNPKISVIVSVYNAEKYLKKCLDSIVNQTLKSIEIICINNESTDDSLKILNRYAKKYSFIRIISQENKGVGNGKNLGIELSEGEYIAFVDADDYLVLNAFEKLYNNITNNNSDLVIFETININSGEEIIMDSFEDLYNPSFFNKVFRERFNIDFEKSSYWDYDNFNFKIYEGLDLICRCPTDAYRKLYKKTFLKEDKELRFPTDIEFEDILFHVKCLTKATKLSWLPFGLYFHIMDGNESKITSTITNSRKIFDIFEILEIVKNFLISESSYEYLKLELLFLYVKSLHFAIVSVNEKYLEEFFSHTKLALNPFHDTCKIDPYSFFNNITYSNFYIAIKESNSIQEFNYNSNILKLEYSINYLNKEIDKTKEKSIKYEKIYKQNRKEIKSMENSNSWKLTKPLRKMINFFKRAKK